MAHKLEEILSRNMQKRMAEQSVEVADLATQTGISASGLYKILDSSRWPSAENLARIAEKLQTTVAQLLVGSEKPEERPSELRELLSALATLDDAQVGRLLAAARGMKGTPAVNAPEPLPRPIKKG